MRSFGILVLCTLLLGCASVRYEEPEGGPRARVRFAIDQSVSDVAVVRAYSDSDCNDEREWMRLFNGFLFRPDPRQLDMPLWDFHENGAKEFYVPVDRPLFLMFEGATTSGNWTFRCAVPVSFQIEPNQDCEIVMSLGRSNCRVVLSRIATEGGAPRRQLLRTFENIASEGCMDAFDRFRWS